MWARKVAVHNIALTLTVRQQAFVADLYGT